MDERAFRHYLKRSGRKPHVIDGLVNQVRAAERYLERERQIGLEAADASAIRSYAQTLERKETKARMRALALYYAFTGRDALARLASELREREIAKTRQPFKLRQFRGVRPADANRLEAGGVITVDDMLAAGKTPGDRQRLSERTGVDPERILELVKLSDLSRLGAVKSVRARLYYDAGLDTPDKFTGWEPDALRQMLIDFVERTGFAGIAPLPKELRSTIAAARALPPLIVYDD